MNKPLAVGPLALPGELTLPASTAGLVLFVSGKVGGRHSPRNRAVAQALQWRRIATLQLDLLTPQETLSRVNGFDIEVMAQRLLQVLDWSRGLAEIAGLPMGILGSSTGAAAALMVAAQRPRDVSALVSRGGRLELAGPVLGDVRTPTLLIVGGADTEVLRLNLAAFAKLKCEKQLEIVPRASHLFAEAGAMETVTRLARDWFARHLGVDSARAS
jgi:putative phosphoribosyl transferase